MIQIDILTTRAVYKESDVELYLSQGWILLSVRTEKTNTPDGEESKFRALVGWPLRNGAGVKPPLKEKKITGKGIKEFGYPFGWSQPL